MSTPMTAGTLSDWLDALAALASRGPEAYPALALLGLSLAAPLAPEVARVNPVLGLVGPASPAQAAAVMLALSVWGDPMAKARNQGPKAGLAALATAPAGEAVALCGLSRLEADPQGLACRLGFLLAGVNPLDEAATAWRGVGFYVGDRPIAPLLPDGLGAAFTELTQAPMPPGSALAGFVQQAARQNFGHAGELVRAHLAQLGPDGARFFAGPLADLASPLAPLASLVGKGLWLLTEALYATQNRQPIELFALEVMLWLDEEAYKAADAYRRTTTPEKATKGTPDIQGHPQGGFKGLPGHPDASQGDAG